MFLVCRSQSVRQPGRPGAQINYREEEKKILDEILGKGVYDNRIRPSGSNGTGEAHTQRKWKTVTIGEDYFFSLNLKGQCHEIFIFRFFS
jgi:hypothetical protein